MNEEQRAAVVRLRNLGWGYKRIAVALEVSRDEVRNYCVAKGLNGCAKDRVKEENSLNSEAENNRCRYCWKPIQQPKTGRRRAFCSGECRRLWNEAHPTIYQHECEFCGKIFESRAAKQSYCCHDCYVKDRFWRKEDTAEIVKCLQERRKPEFVPKWVKDLLL